MGGVRTDTFWVAWSHGPGDRSCGLLVLETERYWSGFNTSLWRLTCYWHGRKKHPRDCQLNTTTGWTLCAQIIIVQKSLCIQYWMTDSVDCTVLPVRVEDLRRLEIGDNDCLRYTLRCSVLCSTLRQRCSLCFGASPNTITLVWVCVKTSPG